MDYISLGYHRVSDDSVTSIRIPSSDIESAKRECINCPDIDYVWTRDASDMVDWYWENH